MCLGTKATTINAPAREIVERRNYNTAHIRRIAEEKLDDAAGEKRYPARRRWVLERTLCWVGWLSKCRRAILVVGYDKKAANNYLLGLIKVASCILLWYRRQHRLSLLR